MSDDSNAGHAAAVHFQQRDIDGLVLCGEHGGVPYDLLAGALGTQQARLRGITARWRRAGYAATGTLGPGPAWCWLTPHGMAGTGLHYRAGPPSLGRLAHVRAVLAARVWLQSLPTWQQHAPWWQSERRITRKGPYAGTHRPDAEVWWPHSDDSPYSDQVWAIEVELTAKTGERTAATMTHLGNAGYHRILYLTASAARTAAERAAAAVPEAPVSVRDLPRAAAIPRLINAPKSRVTRKES